MKQTYCTGDENSGDDERDENEIFQVDTANISKTVRYSVRQ